MYSNNQFYLQLIKHFIFMVADSDNCIFIYFAVIENMQYQIIKKYETVLVMRKSKNIKSHGNMWIYVLIKHLAVLCAFVHWASFRSYWRLINSLIY